MNANPIDALPGVSYPAGATILASGDPPGRLFFLRSGRIEVVRDGMRLALVKTPGSVIGEMSLLLGTPATADVIALEDTVMRVAEEPLAFLSGNPGVALHVARLLAMRLNAASQYLVDVREQLRECSDHVGLVDGVLDAILHRDLKRTLPA